MPVELGEGALAVLSHHTGLPAQLLQGHRACDPQCYLSSVEINTNPPKKKKKGKSKHAMVHIFLLATPCKPGYAAKRFHSRKEACSGKQAVYSYRNFLTQNLLHGPGAVSIYITFKYCTQK